MFCYTDPDTTEIYTLSLHDALPISATIQQNLIKNNDYGIYLRDNTNNATILDNTFTANRVGIFNPSYQLTVTGNSFVRSEEHTSELQSRPHLVCRLLLEKKKENSKL